MNRQTLPLISVIDILPAAFPGNEGSVNRGPVPVDKACNIGQTEKKGEYLCPGPVCFPFSQTVVGSRFRTPLLPPWNRAPFRTKYQDPDDGVQNFSRRGSGSTASGPGWGKQRLN